MWIPQENKEGYDAGSAMTYANQLRGLMLYYGTDSNDAIKHDVAHRGAAELG